MQKKKWKQLKENGQLIWINEASTVKSVDFLTMSLRFKLPIISYSSVKQKF